MPYKGTTFIESVTQNLNNPNQVQLVRRLIIHFTEQTDATAHLLRYSLSRLLRVAALVNDVTDLLAVHYEVDAICGQCQEWVVGMVQLWNEQQIFHLFYFSRTPQHNKVVLHSPTVITVLQYNYSTVAVLLVEVEVKS